MSRGLCEVPKGSDALSNRPQLCAALEKAKVMQCPVIVAKLVEEFFRDHPGYSKKTISAYNTTMKQVLAVNWQQGILVPGADGHWHEPDDRLAPNWFVVCKGWEYLTVLPLRALSRGLP
ncbi:hypothetical protein [Acetobacter sp. LMG 32666]|uniref:hypothetical protein n=1 Tax=Acetobacter sp. LMG 32666 TaxID=2959295 RepID=UPI0030C855B4